jgi:hypothetical protein
MVSLALLKQRWNRLKTTDKILFHGEKDVAIIFVPSKMAVVRAFLGEEGYQYNYKYRIEVFLMHKGSATISHPPEKSNSLAEIKQLAQIVADRVRKGSRYDLR